MKIFSGSSHPKLAQEIAKELKTDLGRIEISQFPNGEKRIYILEALEKETVFLIQPTIKDEDIIELCLMADAAQHLHPKKLVAVIPWFGYCPQDKVFRSGEPLSAKVMAQILEASGIDEVIIVDPHSSKLESFFTIPVTLLSAFEIFAALFEKKNLDGHVVISLDLGDIERSLKFAEALGLPMVLLQKTPRDRQTGKVDFMAIKGRVGDKKVLIFDDFVSTGQTLIKSARFLKKEGAKTITACVTHYLPVAGLPKKLEKSLIDKFYFTNTHPVDKKRKFVRLKIISIAFLIAKAMKKMV